MSTAISLGIILNELVSNALKHAFPAGMRGEMSIILSQAEDYERRQKAEGLWTEQNCPNRALTVVLAIEDNGKTFPKKSTPKIQSL